MRRCNCYYGSGFLCFCRDNRFAGRCNATAAAEPNNLNLNQQYDNDDPYGPEFDSQLRTLSGFLH
jgi:hypothetical protein